MDPITLLDHLVEHFEPKRFYANPRDLLHDFAVCYKQWHKFHAVTNERPEAAECAITAVCKVYDITKEMVIGHSRIAHTCEARQVAMYLMKKYTTLPLQQIALAVNRKDHGTVMNGVRAVTARLETERAFPARFKEVEEVFKRLYGADKDLPLHAKAHIQA